MYSQTGYKIITQRDCNPRSPIYSSTRTISEYNSSLCGLYSFGFVYASYSDGSEQYYRISNGALSIYRTMGDAMYVSDVDGVVTEISNAPSNITYAHFMSVKEINYSTFNGCTALSAVSLPIVQYIDSYAFANCTALSAVSFPNAINISEYAFFKCSKLSSIYLPQVTNIVSYAFANCTALSAVSLPIVQYIDSHAFANCTALSAVSLPKVSRIYSDAFANTAIETLSLPNLDYLPSYALADMPNLKSVYLNIEKISYPTVFWECPSLTDVTIERLSILITGLFVNNRSITNISLPSVRIVSNEAFYNAKFSYIELPMASNIGTLAFQKCSNLEAISLPKAVIIASSAFQSCTNLKSIYVTSTYTTTWGALNPEYNSLYVIISK